MNNEVLQYTEKFQISSSDVDVKNEFGLVGMLLRIQDASSHHSIEMKIDRGTILEKYGAFWVFTRMKTRFYSHFQAPGKLSITTYPLEPSLVRCDRDYEVKNEKGEVIAAAASEWCLIDKDNFRPCKVSRINYPTDNKHIDSPILKDRPVRLKYSPEADDFVYERTIRYSDIDFNRHTNNVSYTRFVMDCFDADYFENNAIKEYDINFENQSYEGEIIKIYRLEQEAGEMYFCGKVGDKRIFTSRIQFERV